MSNLKTTIALVIVFTFTAALGISLAQETRRLVGAYVADDDSGKLEAFFTPNDDGTWQVDFQFSFQDQPLTFSGWAEGGLSEGTLAGTVHNERGNRTFTFKGRFKNGRFHGTHAEIEHGNEFPTGTLTLERPNG